MKYKSKGNLLNELNKLNYFTKEQVFQLGANEKNYNLKKKTIDTYIGRFLKSGDIIALKRGFYIASDFYEKNKYKTAYLFYIANVLRKPSYISSWTALQYYGLTTELIHVVTSVGTKKTENYKTKIALFSYQSIKEELFSDYLLVEENGFSFFIATPAKALFDLLYFKTREFRGLSFDKIKHLIDELRININEMKKSEKEKLFLMIKKYIKYD